LVAVTTLLAYFLLSSLDMRYGWQEKIKQAQTRISIGSPTAWKYKNYWFPVFVFAIFAVLVANQLHGSSVGIYWHYVTKSDTADPALLLGQPRSIRSDEFMVSTPWILSQSQVNFNENNSLLGKGQSLVLTDSPILNWEVLLEPQNWAFFVLPIEYAFSFRWWFRALLLLISSYLFFLQISNEKWYLASLASISTLFMPIVQWWYSTSFVETVAYFFLIVYLFQKAVYHKTIFSLSIWAILFSYFSLCFVSLLYPATLIPGLMGIVSLLVGILFNKWSTEIVSAPPNSSFLSKAKTVLLSKQNKSLFIALLIVLIIDIVFVVLFYIDNRGIIDAMMNSSYPGKVRSLGGTLTPEFLFGGFLNIFLTEVSYPVPIAPNQSEASSFFPLSVFILPVLIFVLAKSMLKKDNPDYFLLFLLLAYIILLIWSFFGLPGIISKSLLLQFSKPRRALLVLGILNQIVIYYYLSRVSTQKSLDFLLFSIIYSVGIFALYLYWMRSITQVNPELLPDWKTGAWISGVIMVLLLLLLLRKKNLFWTLFTIFTLASTASVNPLYRGLDVILRSDLSEALREIDASDKGGDAFWVNYDNVVMSNYMVANGAHLLNATQFSPQNELWSEFDPQGEYIDIYNRYAHIVLNQTESLTDVEIILNQGDVFTLKIHPCNSKLAELGVTHFVFWQEVQYACLQKIQFVDLLNVDYYIYERKQLP